MGGKAESWLNVRSFLKSSKIPLTKPQDVCESRLRRQRRLRNRYSIWFPFARCKTRCQGPEFLQATTYAMQFSRSNLGNYIRGNCGKTKPRAFFATYSLNKPRSSFRGEFLESPSLRHMLDEPTAWVGSHYFLSAR